jgi:hypothetical protein
MKTDPIIRLFCGVDISPLDRDYIAKGVRQILPHAQVRFNESGRGDLAVTLNYDPRLHFFIGPRVFFWKWLTEPVTNRSIVRKFSSNHSKKYTRIFTSGPSSNSREVVQPPLFPPRVNMESVLPVGQAHRKTKLISAIASTLRDLPGHKARDEFIRTLNEAAPMVDLYGRGRPRSLANKEDGLVRYMFSIAIENTSSEHYWSEKITDCFLLDTVPLYFGASKIFDYFPQGSLIWLPLEDPEEAVRLINSLTETQYFQMLDKVQQAKQLVLTKYQLGRRIAREYVDGPHNLQERSRFHLTSTQDTLIALVVTLLLPLTRLLIRFKSI